MSVSNRTSITSQTEFHSVKFHLRNCRVRKNIIIIFDASTDQYYLFLSSEIKYHYILTLKNVIVGVGNSDAETHRTYRRAVVKTKLVLF